MKKIAVFCIPAHGHTNPMLAVVRELAVRGDEVRFYSFSEFQDKIERTGVTFVNCDKYLPELNTVIDVFVHMNKRTAVTRTAPSQG